MAIALDQSPTGTDSAVAGTTIAKAWSSGVPATASLFCIVQWQSSTATCSAADSVNGAWTAMGSPQRDVANSLSAQLFYFLSSGAGTPTVTATISGSVNYRAIVPVSFTGVAAIEGTPSYNFGNATSAPAPTVTPAVGNDMVLAACLPNDTVVSVASPFTMLSVGTTGLGFAYDLLAGTGALTPTFSKNGTANFIGATMVLTATGGAVAQRQNLSLLGVG